ncbi:uncharacterized protein K489DRAFT_381751 [Dissoconium aciculare CBS 342.82]|uniref:Uncharacterized protein n=1 Tax=Dissoconium aciculare CBS 342.82 TaxID=1314786 RepID=A0A6J3M149_9PEZI|nr:uncharacterized protein K489DRAFT_381751 [Dissoconium aciculare CBS 342.82]KAF1821760.1 hypothetical protein K489DRAFT_381751 [Dissoconium aciculare CBS 342.82]
MLGGLHACFLCARRETTGRKSIKIKIKKSVSKKASKKERKKERKKEKSRIVFFPVV